MSNSTFEQMYGSHVYLRKFSLNDIEKVFQMSLEKGMKQWIPDQVYEDEKETKEVLEYLIAQYSSSAGPTKAPIVLGVCSLESDELIGHVGLSPVSSLVEIGYAIEDAYKKNGYAADAITTMCERAFSYYNLPSISAIVASENIPSIKTLERGHFKFLEEKEQIFHDKLTKVKIYSRSNLSRENSLKKAKPELDRIFKERKN